MTARRDATRTPGWVELLAEILAGTPKLPGAACRGHVEQFDRAADGDRDAAQQAVEVCRRCPVLTECRAWADHIRGRKRPAGVLGGQAPRAQAPKPVAKPKPKPKPKPPRPKPKPPPPPPRQPIRHGTRAGWAAHRRRDEPACVSCLAANAEYHHRRRGNRATTKRRNA